MNKSPESISGGKSTSKCVSDSVHVVPFLFAYMGSYFGMHFENKNGGVNVRYKLRTVTLNLNFAILNA